MLLGLFLEPAALRGVLFFWLISPLRLALPSRLLASPHRSFCLMDAESIGDAGDALAFIVRLSHLRSPEKHPQQLRRRWTNAWPFDAPMFSIREMFLRVAQHRSIRIKIALRRSRKKRITESGRKAIACSRVSSLRALSKTSLRGLRAGNTKRQSHAGKSDRTLFRAAQMGAVPVPCFAKAKATSFQA